MIRSKYLRCLFLALWAALLPGRLAAADDLWNLGPLYDHFGLTLDKGDRTEALGPFFYDEIRNESEHTFAVPPLFSYTFDPVSDDHELNFLYPVITGRRYGSVSRWQILQVLSCGGGGTQDGNTNRRVTIFPVLFKQWSADPINNYTALFPIYGHLHERMYRDDIFFVLFPIYCETRKRDVVTDNFLCPFFDVRHGNHLSGWQFWPVVGHEHKDVTTLTNGFGDTELVGGHDKFFAVWPFFARETTGIGTTNVQKELDVLPLYARVRSPERDTTSYLWPFFNVIDDRENKYREWEGPWPFVVFAHGEGKNTKRVLPFFSRARSKELESDSYLWPLFKYDELHADPLEQDRFRILFYLYSDERQKNLQTDKVKRRVDLLPFFTYHRDFNGKTRLQILAPVEPFLPNNTSIEREWAPIWSLWVSEHNPTTDASSQSLLWNLYRRDVAPASKKCSLLFGLFQYQSTVDATRLRLFYIPVVDAKKGPSSVETTANHGEVR
jgi:hypothetical protein